MCGFVAVIGESGALQCPNELRRAVNKLIHRGPDDFGLSVDNEVGLAFRRLSIVDLSKDSHQPFEDSSGRYVLVFNGEIYNYLELREELSSRGHTFRSKGDAEVLLTAYMEWGSECLQHFNGMWAFIIFDRESRTFFGSRDRFGVKPLFMWEDGQRRIFSSEIKGITAMDNVRSVFNWAVTSQYLLSGRLSEPDPGWQTIYEGIMEIPAGHAFTADTDGRFTSWPFWSLPDSAADQHADVAQQFDEIFHDAVRLRLRSDVPVGVCLSGGLDSTAVICHMSKALSQSRQETLHAFSYFDEKFDETEQISATVQATKAELHSLTSSGTSFLDNLTDVIQLHDEPLHSLNALVSHRLYKMAAEHGIKVILNGQGADETWAGYAPYFRNYWYTLITTGRISRARAEIARYADTHQLDSVTLWRQTLRTAFRNQLRRLRPYRSLAGRRSKRHAISDDWFTPDLLSAYHVATPPYQSLNLDTALRNSVTQRPLPLYLRIEDRNSMAHSVETRLPFMDYRLVTLAFRSADEWKLRGGLNKFALREATRGVIPEVVRTRVDKMGFPVSAREWFAGPLYKPLREILSDDSTRRLGVIDPQSVLRDLELHRRGRADFSDKLLRVMQFALLAAIIGAR